MDRIQIQIHMLPKQREFEFGTNLLLLLSLYPQKMMRRSYDQLPITLLELLSFTEIVPSSRENIAFSKSGAKLFLNNTPLVFYSYQNNTFPTVEQKHEKMSVLQRKYYQFPCQNVTNSSQDLQLSLFIAI